MIMSSKQKWRELSNLSHERAVPEECGAANPLGLRMDAAWLGVPQSGAQEVAPPLQIASLAREEE